MVWYGSDMKSVLSDPSLCMICMYVERRYVAHDNRGGGMRSFFVKRLRAGKDRQFLLKFQIEVDVILIPLCFLHLGYKQFSTLTKRNRTIFANHEILSWFSRILIS